MGKKNFIFILFLFSAVTVAYSNCSNKFQALQSDTTNLGSNTDNTNTDPAPTNSIGKAAMEFLTAKCAICHGPTLGNVGMFTDITNLDGLISQNQIVPGDAVNSRIYQSLLASNGVKLMPPGAPASDAEKNLVRDWINAGAPKPSAPVQPPEVVPLAENFNSISKNILIPKCVACHGPTLAEDGVRYDTYAETIKTVRLNNPTASPLYTEVLSGSMPEAPLQPLSNAEVSTILKWIQAGALNN